MKSLLLALLISVSAHSIPIERSSFSQQEQTRPTPSRDSIIVTCNMPEDLVPAAKALIRRYFKTDMYNSSLFDKFLWLHPEYEDFIACVICKSGKPNDPYWERDFIHMCNDREATIFVMEEDSQINFSFL